MNNIFSEYGRKARLFPALLSSFPFIVIKHFAIDPYVGSSTIGQLFSGIAGDVTIGIVLIYLLSQINRLVSKIFFENKTKFPSTIMLLPSNTSFSMNYRKKLEEKISTDFQLAVPTLSDENSDFGNTQIRIQEIVSLIINKVGKGKLLLQHNIEYGFMRNLIGGAVVSLIISIISMNMFHFAIYNKVAFNISLILSFCYLLPILFSKIILSHYSKEYARILFREYIGL